MWKNTAREQVYVDRKEAGICTQCNKPTEDGYVVCAACRVKAPSLKRYYKNKENGLCRSCGADAGGKSKCDACAEKQKAFSNSWYKDKVASGLCTNCGTTKAREGRITCEACNDIKIEQSRIRGRKLKEDVMSAYGGIQCVGCGTVDIEVLEMDHIHGGGCKHLKEIGKGRLYPWLKQNNFPEGFRVLCSNCNKKAHRGTLTLLADKANPIL